MKATRAAGLAGIVSVLLVIGDAIAAGGVPRETASTHTILTYYASSSHWHRQELALVLGALSMVFFLTFLGGLRATLRQAELAPAWIHTVLLAGGVAFAVLFAGLSTMRGTIAFALDNSHAFRTGTLDPQLVRILEQARSLFYLHALVAGAVMIGAASAIALRSRIHPAALAATGALVALIVLLGAFISTAFVFLLLFWIVAVSAILFRLDPQQLALSDGSARASRPAR
jgi:hypothetical protein